MKQTKRKQFVKYQKLIDTLAFNESRELLLRNDSGCLAPAHCIMVYEKQASNVTTQLKVTTFQLLYVCFWLFIKSFSNKDLIWDLRRGAIAQGPDAQKAVTRRIWYCVSRSFLSGLHTSN